MTFVEPPPEYLTRADGVRLAYRYVAGDGPTIVFLPGYMSDMAGGKATALFDWAAGEGHACLLLDYAAFYNVPHLLQALEKAGFKMADQPAIARNVALQRYGVDYHQHGYRDLLRKVERHGVDFRNPLNQTPLMLAVLKGHIGLARVLIEREADVNKTGWAPLHYAATYGGPVEGLPR